MALLAHACSMLLVWVAIKTVVCLKSSCLIASSSRADKISFTECTNETLNFTWSLDIPLRDLEIIKFEYSCVNARNVAIVQNRSILSSDGSRGSAAYVPVPEAICLISACYTDSASSLHYISPTGCTQLPSTSQVDATPINVATSDFAHLMSDVVAPTPRASQFPYQAFSSAYDPSVVPVHKKDLNNRLIVGITIGVIAFAVISVCALALTSITCLTRTVKAKAHQRELKQLGTDTAQEIDQSYSPVAVQINNAHQLRTASSECSVLDDLEWLPPCSVDSNDIVVSGDSPNPKDPVVLEAQKSVVDLCIIAYQEDHSSAFSGHKRNNESFETINSGVSFSLNSNGYCAFKSAVLEPPTARVQTRASDHVTRNSRGSD